MKKCIIVGAGPFGLREFIKNDRDFLIAADGGYRHIKKFGIEPDLLLGDFDSLDFIPAHDNILKYNSVKDDTDMMLAIKLGLDKGYRLFHIYGGIGGRLDHTLANIQALAFIAKNRAQAYMIGTDEVVTAIKDSQISFDSSLKGYISVFSHTDKSFGVCESGFKYSLKDAVLSSDMSMGISNEFIGQEGTISLKSGILIISYQLKIRSNNQSLGSYIGSEPK